MPEAVGRGPFPEPAADTGGGGGAGGVQSGNDVMEDEVAEVLHRRLHSPLPPKKRVLRSS